MAFFCNSCLTFASSAIPSKNFAVLVKLVALSEYKKEGCPLLQDNSHNASKKVNADKDLTDTKYTALVVRQENKQTHNLILSYPCLTSKGPHKSTPVALNGF